MDELSQIVWYLALKRLRKGDSGLEYKKLIKEVVGVWALDQLVRI